MKSDFYTAIAQIAAERGIPKEAVHTAVEHAIKTIYKKEAGIQDEENIEVELDGTGSARVYVRRQVVDDVADPAIEIDLSEARRTKSNAKIGDVLRIERTGGAGALARGREGAGCGWGHGVFSAFA